MKFKVTMTYNGTTIKYENKGLTQDEVVEKAIRIVMGTKNLSLKDVALSNWTIRCVPVYDADNIQHAWETVPT